MHRRCCGGAVIHIAGAGTEVAVDVNPQFQRDLACLIDGNAHLRNGEHRLGILRQGDLPVDVGICGVGICQGLDGDARVLRHICNACKGRCREYESEDQDKRQNLRRQTGFWLLHNFILFFSFFSVVVLGGRPARAATPALGLPPTAPACRKAGAALTLAESLASA